MHFPASREQPLLLVHDPILLFKAGDDREFLIWSGDRGSLSRFDPLPGTVGSRKGSDVAIAAAGI